LPSLGGPGPDGEVMRNSSALILVLALEHKGTDVIPMPPN
jgi:hypothetical protein